jgi:hypothetical protein
MGLKRMPFRNPSSGSYGPMFVKRCADAELARELAFTDVWGQLIRGEIAYWQAVARLRLAYWRAQRDLYDFNEEQAA